PAKDKAPNTNDEPARDDDSPSTHSNDQNKEKHVNVLAFYFADGKEGDNHIPDSNIWRRIAELFPELNETEWELFYNEHYDSIMEEFTRLRERPIKKESEFSENDIQNHTYYVAKYLIDLAANGDHPWTKVRWKHLAYKHPIRTSRRWEIFYSEYILTISSIYEALRDIELKRVRLRKRKRV
ncbi:hypothetical protein CVT24_012408, partial [Panaeolus cyanescens]